MAVYKVPQDVEAEDKFLGPLTFKQFLFGGGAAISGYAMFLLISNGIAVLAFVFLPIFIVFVALAFPWNKDQSTDLWLASRIRFLLFPRKRIWNPSGTKEIVTVTAPKRSVHVYSDGLDQGQVRSRMSALASVVDSRGWAVKSVTGGAPQIKTSDRLVVGNTVSVEADHTIVNNTRDVLDETNNPLANQFDSMIQKSEDTHRKATLDMVDKALHHKDQPTTSATNDKKADDFWFLNQPEQPTDPNLAAIKSNPIVQPGQEMSSPVEEKGRAEDEFLSKVHKRQAVEKKTDQLGRIKTIQPLNKLNTASTTPDNHSKLPVVSNDKDLPNSNQQNANATSATPVDPGILALAHNDDLNVETIARQANKTESDDEVIVDLH